MIILGHHLATFLTALTFASPIFAAQLYQIIVNIPATTPYGSEIFLTGNTKELCHWEPRCLKLHPLNDQRAYQATLTFSEATVDSSVDSTVEFKITRGSWETEASFLSGVSPENLVWKLSNPQVVFSVPHWKDLSVKTAPSNLLIFKNFYSPQLQNYRHIRILLPPSYQQLASKRYPVIYAHDGQNLFDPSTSNGGSDWALDLAMQRLYQTAAIREAIIVGIDSKQGYERYDEYDYLIKGRTYSHFLIETLKPWVDQTFRTLTDRLNTFSMGSSMGALISTALVWNHAAVFSSAASLSLPVFIHDQAIYKITEKAKPNQPIRIYMDHGGVGRDENYEPYSRDFHSYLLRRGFRNADELFYQIFPFADHTETDWARRVEGPLQWLLR
jgi:predicted alpha/beta superfamily hydrolase